MAAPTLGPSESIRILLLEDNPSDAELCIRRLQRAELKVEVDHVGTSRDFMDRARTQSYDIVLTDSQLPNWTAWMPTFVAIPGAGYTCHSAHRDTRR